MNYKISGNRLRILKEIGIFIGLQVLLFLMFSFIKGHIDRIFKVVDDDYSWVFQVDELYAKDNKLYLDGFAFELGTDAGLDEYQIILYDQKNDKGYYTKVEYYKREDVNKYFMCEYDYVNSGFLAHIQLNKLDTEQVYEMLIRPEGTRNSYATNIFIKAGKIYYTDPDSYIQPDGLIPELEKIVTHGVLRVYRPEQGVYVYQYDDDLYWIFESTYGFVNGDTNIQYQMNTTQIDRLPSERLEKGWKWSNISFKYSTNVVSDMGGERYKVAKCELPKEYSITKIWTGNYIDDWLWRQDFRPWYKFE